MDLFTIGHSNHPAGRFLEMLRQHRIELIADVRSVPHSRRHPQFNREALAEELGQAGIGYEFLGRELGARADDPLLYEDGRVSYSRLAATGLFQFGLDRLRELAASRRTAIMCAEKEPLDCHRTLLVARNLLKRESGSDPNSGSDSNDVRSGKGTDPRFGSADLRRPEPGSDPNGGSDPMHVFHILADGSLEPHHECMLRLVKMTKLPADDLFRTEAELIDEACAKREEKIAFRR